MNKNFKKSILKVAHFYDGNKVGDIGPLGFRRSTDLMRLTRCVDNLLEKKFLVPGQSLFLDMGCADGRVNVLFSYFVKRSIGIELDEWSLGEYSILKDRLETVLKEDNLLHPPDNVSLFHGDTTDESLHGLIRERTGLGFEDFDLFYTYLTMNDEFADLIRKKAKEGALFMVYGLDRIMPRYKGLRLLTPDKPLGGILALYRKEHPRIP
jgi:hypothetical protein